MDTIGCAFRQACAHEKRQIVFVFFAGTEAFQLPFDLLVDEPQRVVVVQFVLVHS